MELLLNHNVDGLGRVGDVVEVKDGYGRNFLLPLGHAVPVTKGNLAQIKKARQQAHAEETVRLEGLKGLSQKISEVSVTIEGRANEEGHLFGSVNQAQIAAALQEKGFEIEEKMVRLEVPLKEIGVFDVTIHLHGEIEAIVKVWVVQAKPEA